MRKLRGLSAALLAGLLLLGFTSCVFAGGRQGARSGQLVLNISTFYVPADAEGQGRLFFDALSN